MAVSQVQSLIPETCIGPREISGDQKHHTKSEVVEQLTQDLLPRFPNHGYLICHRQGVFRRSERVNSLGIN